MRLEYPTSDPTRWAQDKLYIEDILEATPSELLDPLFDLLNLDMCWTQGRGDGDIDDKCEAICSWYDNHFRPYLRQMVRKDMPKIGLRVSWKALECYIYEFYIESERWPCGQLRGFEARVKELKS